jgi:hypothetical protein
MTSTFAPTSPPGPGAGADASPARANLADFAAGSSDECACGGCTCGGRDALATVAGTRFTEGLPEGIDEVPLLGAALVAAAAVDRAVAQLLACLVDLEEHQVAETLTGVALEQWLAIVGRRTGSDRRMLFTACEVLRRLPSLRDAFLIDATVSWAQTRSVVLQVERLPQHLDPAIDAALAKTIATCHRDDPDVLPRTVSQALRSIEAEAAPDRTEPSSTRTGDEFLAIQPRLDGSGGTLFGEFGAEGLATIDAALTPPPHECRDGGGHRGATARGRARRLVEVCDAALDGGTLQPAGDDGEGGSRPQLVVRVNLSTLLDRDQTPAGLLTRLTGGRLWADAETVRQLVEERGADLRAVILDDTGRVVGVGRKARIAPGWLNETMLALHDTCTAPGCAAPARSCDTDHASPWHTTTRGQPRGRTDVDELAPLCRTHNRTKETAGWQVTQDSDGVRHWRHPGTGLATTTRPATWQPPPDIRVPEDRSTRQPSRIDGVRDESPWPDLARERRPRWDAGHDTPARASPSGAPAAASRTSSSAVRASPAASHTSSSAVRASPAVVRASSAADEASSRSAANLLGVGPPRRGRARSPLHDPSAVPTSVSLA